MPTAVSPTENTITRTPAGYDEYLALPDAAHIVEWANEEIITYMPPTDQHQDLARFLAVFLDGFVRALSLGVLRFAPFEVKLWPEGPSREPDLLFVAGAHRNRLTEKRMEGAPDLVIEIVSPGTAAIDRVDKFLEYQEAGVGEYWIIDPRRYRRQADFYRLGENGRFGEAPIGDDGVYHAAALPGLWLRLAWLWQEPLPNPQVCLAEVLMAADAAPPKIRAAYKTLYDAFAESEAQDTM